MSRHNGKGKNKAQWRLMREYEEKEEMRADVRRGSHPKTAHARTGP